MNSAEGKQRMLSEMDALMRSLRQCDTQATAVAWMARAYNAMDGSALNRSERKQRRFATK